MSYVSLTSEIYELSEVLAKAFADNDQQGIEATAAKIRGKLKSLGLIAYINIFSIADHQETILGK